MLQLVLQCVEAYGGTALTRRRGLGSEDPADHAFQEA